MAAAVLARKWVGAEVTVLNPVDRFVERVRMHQLASGQELRRVSVSGLASAAGIEFVLGSAAGIDPEQRTVQVAGTGGVLPYDVLVLAVGSSTELGRVAGAYGVSTLPQALALRDRLPRSRRVAVVGAGLTGIETATEIAESWPGIAVSILDTGEIGAARAPRGRAHLDAVFTRLGIEPRPNVRVAHPVPDGLELTDRTVLPADTVVWTTGFRAPSLAGDAGLKVDERGRVVTDHYLRSVSHPEVIAVGDAAAAVCADGTELRMACATGVPTAQQAIRALAARVAGKPMRPLRFRYFNQCLSLGRRDGLIQFVDARDRPRSFVLTGHAARGYKEAIVRSALWFQSHPTLPTTF